MRGTTILTAQHSTTQHSTAQHSTAQHSTAQQIRQGFFLDSLIIIQKEKDICTPFVEMMQVSFFVTMDGFIP